MPISKRGKNLLFSKKAITRTQAIAIVIILFVVIAAAYFATRLLSSGPDGSFNGNGSDGNGNGEPPQQPQLPDLTISGIRIYPSEPQAGIAFNALVYVANRGEAKSGYYDLDLWILDMSADESYLIGKFRQDPMHPGEDYCVYNDQVKINVAGSYRFYAEITPLGFEESDYVYNKTYLPFNVKP